MSVLEEIQAESSRAAQRWGLFESSHEGLGVLVEEVAELTDAVRSNNLEALRREAIQVASVAMRIAQSCSIAGFRLRSVP